MKSVKLKCRCGCGNTLEIDDLDRNNGLLSFIIKWDKGCDQNWIKKHRLMDVVLEKEKILRYLRQSGIFKDKKEK